MPEPLPNTGTASPPPSSPSSPSSPSPGSGSSSPSGAPDLPSGTATPQASVGQALSAFERYRTGAPAPAKPPKPAPDHAAAPAPEPPVSDTDDLGVPEGDAEEAAPDPNDVLDPMAAAAAAASGAPAPGRDYSDLDPTEVPFFRQMSKSAFEFLKPRYLESKRLKEENAALKAEQEANGKQSFYDTPNAYQVTPEYQAYMGNVSSLDGEIVHWRAQLANIRAGEKWTPIVMGPNGRPVLGDPEEPSAAAEADIVDAITNARILRQDALNKANSLKESFGSKHQSFLTQMSAVRKDIFKDVDDKTLTKVREAKLAMFPKHLHSDPRIQIIAELLGVFDGFQIMLKERGATVAAATGVQRTATNAGPRARNLQAGSKPNTVAAAMNKFDAYKQKQNAY